LRAEIASVLAQSYPHFVRLVHDDGSSDETWAIMHEFHDSRLRLFRSRSPHGMVPGWNYLLRRARGQYCKQMGADDLLAPNCLAQELAALLAHPTAALVTCRRNLIDAHGRHLRYLSLASHNQVVPGFKHARWVLTTIRENKIGEPVAVLFPRRLLTRAGAFDPRFSQFADFEFWLRLLSCGDLVYLHLPLVSFRRHPEAHTTRALADGRYIPEIYRLIRKYYSSPVFSRLFSLTPTLRRRVTWQKTLDVAKTIKDLAIADQPLLAIRFSFLLLRSLVLLPLGNGR